jgi:hypothetical protein
MDLMSPRSRRFIPARDTALSGRPSGSMNRVTVPDSAGTVPSRISIELLSELPDTMGTVTSPASRRITRDV